MSDQQTKRIRTKRTKDAEEYDILQLDDYIKKFFENEKKKLPDYIKRVISILQILLKIEPPYGIESKILDELQQLCFIFSCESSDTDEYDIKFTYREYLDLYQELKQLVNKITDIKYDKSSNTYLDLSKQIVSEYQKILSIPIKSLFIGKNKEKMVQTEQKKTLLQKFTLIIDQFTNIHNLPFNETTTTKEHKCKCGNKDNFHTSDTSMICEECGLEMPIILSQTSYKDIDRINMHQKYKYEKKSHFKDTIRQYQGKQNKYIPDNLYKQAELWLIKHGLITDVAKDPENKKERYKKVKKEHIRLFLSEYGEINYYEDINFIYAQLTGETCPDLSEIEPQLYEDFDKLVEAFLNDPDITRTNFLNSQYVLRQLLIRHRFKFNEIDFPGLKTRERQREHDTIYQKLADKLCWTYSSSI